MDIKKLTYCLLLVFITRAMEIDQELNNSSLLAQYMSNPKSLSEICCKVINDNLLSDSITIPEDRITEQAKDQIKKALIKYNSNLFWSMQKYKQSYLRILGVMSAISSIEINNDGSLFVCSAIYCKNAYIIDKQSCKVIAHLIGHNDATKCITLSNNNSFIVTGSYDNTIKIWDIYNHECIKTLKGHTNYINSVKVSADNKFIVSGSADKTAKIWDLEMGECISTLIGHSGIIKSVAISHDNKFVITGSDDNTVRIWDTKSSNCLATLIDHTAEVTSVGISSDSSFILTADRNGIIFIWKIKNGTLTKSELAHDSPKNRKHMGKVIISTDDSLIVGISNGLNKIYIWDTKTEILLKEFTKIEASSVAISSDNSAIIISNYFGAIHILSQPSEIEAILRSEISIEKQVDLINAINITNNYNNCLLS